MGINVEDKKNAIDLLEKYSGNNPYLLNLKKDFFNGKTSLNDFNTEYILKNYDKEPKLINKNVKITQWYGEKLQNDWEIDFLPKILKIKYLLGETETTYHCLIKYRQNMDYIYAFLNKKGVMTDFITEDFHNIKVDFDRYNKLSQTRRPDKEPRFIKPHQKEAVQFLLARKKCVLADDMGLGKMEPVSSLIPTPEGFKRMGDIKVGDKIFGSDGKEHNVLKTFPHKDKEIYRVKFSDGTFAECGLEHLWVVRDSNMRIRKKGWKTMSLKEMLESGLTYDDKKRKEDGLNPRSKYEIPVSEPVNYKEKEYFIHPYVLGYCIGDGNMCNGSINISIPDFEKESVYRIESLLNKNFHLNEDRSTNCPRYRIIENKRSDKNLYIREFKRLKLNIKGNYKFIPEEYKMGSIQQRLDLLRGLMDSDGTIQNNNKIIFNTISEKLANDVKELVYSLGGVARIHHYDRRKEGKNIEYHVNIQIKENPFYLTRKAEKYHPTFKKYCTKHIVSAEYVRNEDAQCLYVDSEDHTYLTGKSYIVTHNTMSLTVAAIEGNFDCVLVICPASLKSNWFEELTYFVPEREISIIGGFTGMKKNELERYLGYGVGKSGKTIHELQEETKKRGKWNENRFVIVNYDILDEFLKIPNSRKKVDIEEAYNKSPLLQFISGKKSLIIVDEAHNLSNMKSQQYKIINSLIHKGKPDSVYFATGTPITNNPQNYYNLLYLIDCDITNDWQYYIEHYCEGFKMPINEEEKEKKKRITNEFVKNCKKNSWYDLTDTEKKLLNEELSRKVKFRWIPKGASNLDELKERTKQIYLRRTKEDFNELPEKHVLERIYLLSDEEKQEYDRLWEEYEREKLEENPNKELNKELLEGGLYRKYLSNKMVPHTIKFVNRCLEKNEKVIIICCYDEELYTLRDYYSNKCVIYNGKMSSKEKDYAKNEFMNNPEVKVIIGNIDSIGVGLNLTVSRLVIFNNFSFVPGINRQAEDRVYRIGQKRDVFIYYQFFKDTQYEKMWDTVLRKELVINQIIKKENEK